MGVMAHLQCIPKKQKKIEKEDSSQPTKIAGEKMDASSLAVDNEKEQRTTQITCATENLPVQEETVNNDRE